MELQTCLPQTEIKDGRSNKSTSIVCEHNNNGRGKYYSGSGMSEMQEKCPEPSWHSTKLTDAPLY